MKHVLFILLILAGVVGYSQAQDRPLIQFSGRIFNRDTDIVVPNVTIYDRSMGNRSFSANYQGYFSFVVHEGDTVVFTSLGYRREAVVVPKGLLDKKYTVAVFMKADNITLPIVTVLPWNSKDEFDKDFLTMKVADDDMEIARKNISRDKILAMSSILYRDAGEIQSMNFRNNHISLGTSNMNSTGSLFNPFAWGNLIKQIIKGDTGRSN
jgi:hypothetical protein